MRTARRPAAEATPDEVRIYHRAVANALEELGIKHGEEFSITPLEPSDKVALGPFASDSETSRKAALDNYPRSGSQRLRVLICIFSQPRTREQIADALNLGGDSVRPRVWELEQGGFVEETGETRRTRQGSEAAVLDVTLMGAEQIRKRNPKAAEL